MNPTRTYVSLLAALILVGCGEEPIDEPKLDGSEADAREEMDRRAALLRKTQILADLHRMYRERMQHQQEQIPLKEQLRAKELKKKSDLGEIRAR